MNPEETHKLLHLVLFSSAPAYQAMYRILSPYYRTQFPHVKTVFYTYSPRLSTPFELNEDVLTIQGNESYIPGILEKTLKVFSYFLKDVENETYNYVVRSNVSTIVNFDILIPLIQEKRIEYGGGSMGELFNNLNPGAGIVDTRWKGLVWGSGTGILFSRDCFVDMMNHQDKIRTHYIDDIAIAIYFREHRPDIVPTGTGKDKFVCVDGSIHGDKERLKNLVKQEFAFYRNNQGGSRQGDIANMRMLVHLLLK